MRDLAPDADLLVARVATVAELSAALEEACGGTPRFTVVQAVVPALDVPDLLTTIAQAAAAVNRRTALDP